MMKRTGLYLVLMILLIVPLAEARQWNGHNWIAVKKDRETAQYEGNEWEEIYLDSVRINYIRGLLDASYYLNRKNMRKYYPKPDLTTIFADLDEFYSNNNNLRIPVIRALHIIGKRHLKEESDNDQ